MDKIIESSELPFVKAPYEQLNKTFRSSQKSIEKDLAIIEKVLKDSSKKNLNEVDGMKLFDKISNKLKGIKRKLAETDVEEEKNISICRKRLEYLSSYDSKNPTNVRSFNQTRVDRTFIEHLLRQGHFETAKALAKEKDIEDFVDIEVFLSSKSIIDDLQKHSCKVALGWCSENKSRLKKLNSTFEFHLNLQEFIELIREDKKKEAILYSRKYFSNQKENIDKIQRAMALLAFGKNTELDPYKELFSLENWNELIKEFKSNLYLIYGLTSNSKLNILLQVGLTSLKTPMPYEEDNYNVNDPLCDPRFQELAKDLPFAHFSNSKLICRITGLKMDTNNPPMVLPNGNVYSWKAMREMSLKNDGIVKDPRSNDRYNFDQLKKAFIM